MVAEGEDIAAPKRALWLEARWLAVASWQQSSWAGQRVAAIIERTIRRDDPRMLDRDLQDLSRDARHQQQLNMAIARTMLAVIPILGVMGSLISLSNVLVQAESLTQSGIALTVGLGSAVAPLVVALGMTIPLLFISQAGAAPRCGLSRSHGRPGRRQHG